MPAFQPLIIEGFSPWGTSAAEADFIPGFNAALKRCSPPKRQPKNFTQRPTATLIRKSVNLKAPPKSSTTKLHPKTQPNQSGRYASIAHYASAISHGRGRPRLHRKL